jgi:hypothetical protein
MAHPIFRTAWQRVLFVGGVVGALLLSIRLHWDGRS